MDFQLPFNSRVRVRLFHPVKVADSPCHRVVDIFGLSYDRDNYQAVDAISVGYASQFHHPDHSCQKPVPEIEKEVDKVFNKQQAASEDAQSSEDGATDGTSEKN